MLNSVGIAAGTSSTSVIVTAKLVPLAIPVPVEALIDTPVVGRWQTQPDLHLHLAIGDRGQFATAVLKGATVRKIVTAMREDREKNGATGKAVLVGRMFTPGRIEEASMTYNSSADLAARRLVRPPAKVA